MAIYVLCLFCFFFFQAEDGIRDLVRSRGLGDVYKRQPSNDFIIESFLFLFILPSQSEANFKGFLSPEIILSLIHI